jgi:hypothetical protein
VDTKSQDVRNILKLYELRRDDALRRARAWYLSEFNPTSASDIVNTMMSGFESSANYRMVTSYWDMAASFVNNGGIDDKMFLEANTEHMVVFSKIEPFIAEVRDIFREPDYLIQLERLVMKAPDAQEILARRRKLLERWSKVSRKSAS